MNWKFIAIAFAGYYLMQSVGTQIANQLSIGKPRLRLGSFKPTGVQATLSLPVQNGNSISLPIDAFQGQVLYGAYPLSAVYLDAPKVIQAGSSTEIKFNIFLDTSSFTGSVVDVIDSGEWLQSLRLKGNLTSKGIVFPVDRTLQLFTL